MKKITLYCDVCQDEITTYEYKSVNDIDCCGTECTLKAVSAQLDKINTICAISIIISNKRNEK